MTSSDTIECHKAEFSYAVRKRTSPMNHCHFSKRPWIVLCLFFLIFGPFSTPISYAQRADANVLAANAAIAYDDKRYDEALALLNKALELDPEHERSLFYKGLVHLAQNNPREAITALESVHALQPTDLNVQHHLGVAYFSNGNYDKSKPFLEAAFQQNPGAENLGYYVGFLRYRNKQYGKAVDAFEKNQTSDPDTEQLNAFYRGLALGILGLPGEALIELEQVQRTQAISPLTQSSIRIREALTAGQIFGTQRRFRFQINVGGFYDDNVAINPNALEGPIPIQNPPTDPNLVINALRERDTTAPGFITNIRADYSFLRQGPFEAVATYSFFQTVYGEGLGNFNIQDHQVGLSGFYRGVVADIPFQLGLQYFYDYLFLDMAGFLSRHSPTLSATVVGPNFKLPLLGNVGNLTTFLYRYQVQTFFREVGNFDIRFRGDLRDAFNNTLGFIHAFRMANDKLLIRLGYHYDNESTEGAAFSYRGHRILTGGQLQLPWGNMILRYDYDVHWRDYKNNQTTVIFTDRDGFLSRRDDTQQIHLVQLTKPLPNNFAITGQYQGIRNSSNIPIYDYNKNVWTVIVTWAY